MELWGIIVPALILAGVWIAVQAWRDRSSDRWVSIVGALAWVAYWYWESQIVQPGDNIRVDLLLFWPLLLGITIAAGGALVAIWRRRRLPPPASVG